MRWKEKELAFLSMVDVSYISYIDEGAANDVLVSNDWAGAFLGHGCMKGVAREAGKILPVLKISVVPFDKRRPLTTVHR